jgi:pseudouridine-5'-phosphate glycosidase
MKTMNNICLNIDSGLNPTVLVETALLGQGLPSVKNSQIRSLWPKSSHVATVWVEQGVIRMGFIEKFLNVRDNQGWLRADERLLQTVVSSFGSAFLTASALFPVAAQLEVKMVVTAGMGGVRGNTVSLDMNLCNYNILLIASAPKDSLGATVTISMFRKSGVRVIGYSSVVSDGFLFVSEKDIRLDGLYGGEGPLDLVAKNKSCLLLNAIPHEKRLSNRGYLQEAIKAGEQSGKNFHPMVNKVLDDLTEGLSSEIQLLAFITNIEVALEINGQR